MDNYFEEIKKINSTCRVVKVKGKDYTPVSEKIRMFREVCIGWSIICIDFKIDPKFAYFHYATKDEKGEIRSYGTAFEIQNSESKVNDQNYVENAETSAVGRALSMLGIGIEYGGIPSAEDMQNVVDKGQLKTEYEKQATTKDIQATINHFIEKFIVKIKSSKIEDIDTKELDDFFSTQLYRNAFLYKLSGFKGKIQLSKIEDKHIKRWYALLSKDINIIVQEYKNDLEKSKKK